MKPHAMIGDNPELQDVTDVWLWAHSSTDGAGEQSDHFSYICEEGIVQTCDFLLGLEV